MNKSLLKNLHSPSNFLLMLAKQGLEPDLYGGRKQSLSFSILTRLNNNTVTIDTNQVKQFVVFNRQSFTKQLNSVKNKQNGAFG